MYNDTVSIEDEIPWCDKLKFVLVNGNDAKLYDYIIDLTKEYYQSVNEYIRRLRIPNEDMDTASKVYMICSSGEYGAVYSLHKDIFVKECEFDKSRR